MTIRELIVVRYTSIDHFSKRRTFRTVAAARKFAHNWIGPHPEIGLGYAISFDGVGRITCSGITLENLFPEENLEPLPKGYKPLNAPPWCGPECGLDCNVCRDLDKEEPIIVHLSNAWKNETCETCEYASRTLPTNVERCNLDYTTRTSSESACPSWGGPWMPF